MRHLSLAICAVLFWGCHKQVPSTPQQVAKFKAGDPVSALVTAMSLERYEVRYTQNLPSGTDSAHYYLPDGDLYVDSKNSDLEKMDPHAWVLSSPPYFEPSQTPAAQRVASGDKAAAKAWEEYVHAHTGR